MHPEVHGNRNQSLAEATIRPECVTMLHKHLQSEELYHVVSGFGRMTLGKLTFPVMTGDTICIAPGVAHQLENTKDQDLVILCCCQAAIFFFPPHMDGGMDNQPSNKT